MEHKSIKVIILDMDGVLWRGPDPIGDLPKIFRSIRNKGWRAGFLTNNATRNADFYASKLQQLGVQADTSQVITSAQATGEYLAKQFPGGGKIFIIGESGLVDILSEYGFTSGDGQPLAVVVGLDRDLTYEKIRQATSYLRAGALFIGTNRDPTLPTPEGIIPGAGSILAALEVASGCQPVVLGKPNPQIFQLALSRLGSTPEHTMVVGDRLDTDIAGGKAAGCQTALVLTGDVQRKDVESSDLTPDYIAEDLTQLIGMLP